MMTVDISGSPIHRRTVVHYIPRHRFPMGSLPRDYRILWIGPLLLWCGMAIGGERVDPAKLGASEYCGHCHTDIFHQWNASTHHFSSFNNPVYRKVVLGTVEHKGMPAFAFCANCHDPLLKSAGETSKLEPDNWQSNAGITCLSCHRIMEIGAGNGDYRIQEPILHPFALSDEPKLAKAHKTLIELTPWLHRQVLSKPFYGSPEYCAACHSLTVPPSINGGAAMAFTDELGQLRRRQAALRGRFQLELAEIQPGVHRLGIRWARDARLARDRAGGPAPEFIPRSRDPA